MLSGGSQDDIQRGIHQQATKKVALSTGHTNFNSAQRDEKLRTSFSEVSIL
jgi:hypothetical protein